MIFFIWSHDPLELYYLNTNTNTHGLWDTSFGPQGAVLGLIFFLILILGVSNGYLHSQMIPELVGKWIIYLTQFSCRKMWRFEDHADFPIRFSDQACSLSKKKERNLWAMKAHFRHPFLLYVPKRLVVSEVIDDDFSLIPLSFKVLYSSSQPFLLKRLGQWSNPKDAVKWFKALPDNQRFL